MNSIPEKNRIAQEIAKQTISELHNIIKVGMSEKEIEAEALRLMEERGSNSWWYHGVGALVLLGNRSRLSLPGKEFFASDSNRVAQNDVITIDLAPTVDGFWGDYARTLFMENGAVAPEDLPEKAEHRAGLDAELHLHNYLVERLSPDMTYEDAFRILNEEISSLGFVNLDFHANLGHSVELDKDDRVYLEKGSSKTFREVAKPFTLEPHIALPGGPGYKRENIYYINGDRFVCL